MTEIKRTKPEVIGKLNDKLKEEFIRHSKQGKKVKKAREAVELLHAEYSLECKKFWIRLKEEMNIEDEPHLHIDEETFEVLALPPAESDCKLEFLKDLFKKEK